MFRSLMVLIAVLFAVPAFAQTAPGPAVSLAFNRPLSPSCENPTPADAWNFTYGTCYLPTGVNVGDAWIGSVKIVFGTTPAVTKVIPRTQVIQGTTPEVCQGATIPCLRVNNVPAPTGNAPITVSFTTTDGREGAASPAVPFTGSAPTVPAGAGVRVIPNP